MQCNTGRRGTPRTSVVHSVVPSQYTPVGLYMRARVGNPPSPVSGREARRRVSNGVGSRSPQGANLQVLALNSRQLCSLWSSVTCSGRRSHRNQTGKASTEKGHEWENPEKHRRRLGNSQRTRPDQSCQARSNTRWRASHLMLQRGHISRN